MQGVNDDHRHDEKDHRHEHQDLSAARHLEQGSPSRVASVLGLSTQHVCKRGTSFNARDQCVHQTRDTGYRDTLLEAFERINGRLTGSDIAHDRRQLGADPGRQKDRDARERGRHRFARHDRERHEVDRRRKLLLELGSSVFDLSTEPPVTGEISTCEGKDRERSENASIDGDSGERGDGAQGPH
jgi:hypothetical protein